jgi:hypothetical protein
MNCFAEPTLDEVLSDPLIQDVMASDGVDQRELEAALAEVAVDIRRRKPARSGRIDTAVARAGRASPAPTIA